MSHVGFSTSAWEKHMEGRRASQSPSRAPTSGALGNDSEEGNTAATAASNDEGRRRGSTGRASSLSLVLENPFAASTSAVDGRQSGEIGQSILDRLRSASPAGSNSGVTAGGGGSGGGRASMELSGGSSTTLQQPARSGSLGLGGAATRESRGSVGRVNVFSTTFLPSTEKIFSSPSGLLGGKKERNQSENAGENAGPDKTNSSSSLVVKPAVVATNAVTPSRLSLHAAQLQQGLHTSRTSGSGRPTFLHDNDLVDGGFSIISDDDAPTPDYVPEELRYGMDDGADIFFDANSLDGMEDEEGDGTEWAYNEEWAMAHGYSSMTPKQMRGRPDGDEKKVTVGGKKGRGGRKSAPKKSAAAKKPPVVEEEDLQRAPTPMREGSLSLISKPTESSQLRALATATEHHNHHLLPPTHASAGPLNVMPTPTSVRAPSASLLDVLAAPSTPAAGGRLTAGTASTAAKKRPAAKAAAKKAPAKKGKAATPKPKPKPKAKRASGGRKTAEVVVISSSDDENEKPRGSTKRKGAPKKSPAPRKTKAAKKAPAPAPRKAASAKSSLLAPTASSAAKKRTPAASATTVSGGKSSAAVAAVSGGSMYSRVSSRHK